MAKSIFRDKAFQPDDDMIASVLSGSKVFWEGLVAHVYDNYPNVIVEWKYYGSAWGWCLVLTSKKKKLVYLTPEEGRLLCSLIFNDKGRELARQAGFAGDILEIINAGKDNTAGHTFDITVADPQAFELAKQLINIKAAS